MTLHMKGNDSTLDGSLQRPMDRSEAHPMRQFDTGAIRDQNASKLDYKGFTSEAADRLFAEYMHKHRKQADGSMRGSDNWKLGIPLSAYEESLYRHFKEFFQALERGEDKSELARDIVQAIRFNLQGWVHEVMKLGWSGEYTPVFTGSPDKPTWDQWIGELETEAETQVPENYTPVDVSTLSGFPIGYELTTVSGNPPSADGQWERAAPEDLTHGFTWKRVG